MARLFLAAAALLVVAPAYAQASEDVAPDVDTKLVGEWRLIEVGDHGELGEFGAEIEAMRCTFTADGEAQVHIEVMQDRDTHQKAVAFEFVTEGGQIVPDDAAPVQYTVLGSDLLELRDARGLVVRLVRADG